MPPIGGGEVVNSPYKHSVMARFILRLACGVLLVIAGGDPTRADDTCDPLVIPIGESDVTEDPAVIVYDFRSGYLDWNGEWNTNNGRDDYKSFYRVDRLRGGYIIRDHQSYHSSVAYNYFHEMVQQIVKPHEEHGFWDNERKAWIRKLLWSETEGWYGMVPHDWKYSIELEEGALMATMISGFKAMAKFCGDELHYIHSHVNADGSVADITFETHPYEYGLILSSLALGTLCFKDGGVIDHDSLSEHAYADMKKVYRYIGKQYAAPIEPAVSTSTLLKGFVNAYITYGDHPGTGRERQQLLRFIEELVSLYMRSQEARGSFDIGYAGRERVPVQQQLKADIALMLAHRVTGDPAIPAAVEKNLDWVTTDRWDHSEKCMGGILWSADDTTTFFEAHQMWFLIAASYLEDATGRDYSKCKAEVFTFLTDDNFAGIDAYVHNAEHYGAFFAYRSISADGTIQKGPDHCFKGGYEIGASLWAMALNYDLFDEGHTWLITQPPAGESNGWDKAIFTERDFGPGNMMLQWDVQFMNAEAEGGYTGLFNDQNGDWRILFSSTSGIHYRTLSGGESIVLDRSRLHSNLTYTVRITRSGRSRVTFVVLEEGRELLRDCRYDVMPFDACYFGVLQYNADSVPSKNILVDDIVYRKSVDPPHAHRLEQNFPNPFNARTAISFDVGTAGRVTLSVFDPAGRLIRRLVDEPLERNNYTVFWDGTNTRGAETASGVYFYMLSAGDFNETKKMILLR